jgi:hypothetical protein
MPLIIFGVVVLLVVIGVLGFLANQRGGAAVPIVGTPSAVARATTGPPPTLAAPSPTPSQLTATPLPSPTPLPSLVPTALPTTAPTIVPPKPVAQASPAQPSPATERVSPTALAGQVSGPGGLGNTRDDLQATYGAPIGETPEHLVVFRKETIEYRVELVPDLNGRATLIEEVPSQGGQPWALEAAMAEAHNLLPKDVQPPSPSAEGNDQFVVQRLTSQSLAQALGDAPFTAVQAGPGQLLAAYVRDTSQDGRVTRIVVGTGNDPGTLLSRAR